MSQQHEIERELIKLQGQANKIISHMKDAGIMPGGGSEREVFMSLFITLVAKELHNIADKTKNTHEVYRHG